MKVDHSTLNLSQTTAARVCIELDISKPRPTRVWIGLPIGRAWQDVLYPDLPTYCSSCSCIGHNVVNCKGQMILDNNLKSKLNAPSHVLPVYEPKGKADWQPILNQKDKAEVNLPSTAYTSGAHSPSKIQTLGECSYQPAIESEVILKCSDTGNTITGNIDNGVLLLVVNLWT